MSGLIQFLWKALNDLSSLTILFVIGVPVSGMAQILSKIILQFSQFDILPSDLINTHIFTFSNNDHPINTYFDAVGFQYSNAARNMGSAFLFLAFDAFLLALILLSRIFGPAKLAEFLNRKLLWNYFLRFMI